MLCFIRILNYLWWLCFILEIHFLFMLTHDVSASLCLIGHMKEFVAIRRNLCSYERTHSLTREFMSSHYQYTQVHTRFMTRFTSGLWPGPSCNLALQFMHVNSTCIFMFLVSCVNSCNYFARIFIKPIFTTWLKYFHNKIGRKEPWSFTFHETLNRGTRLSLTKNSSSL